MIREVHNSVNSVNMRSKFDSILCTICLLILIDEPLTVGDGQHKYHKVVALYRKKSHF